MCVSGRSFILINPKLWYYLSTKLVFGSFLPQTCNARHQTQRLVDHQIDACCLTIYDGVTSGQWTVGDNETQLLQTATSNTDLVLPKSARLSMGSSGKFAGAPEKELEHFCHDEN